jgi:hypothetical protein
MLPISLFAVAVLFATQTCAQGLLPTHRISAEMAAQAVEAAVAKCASQGYAETAVLVDVDGVRQAVLRGDRTGSHTLDSAYQKAYTAASFKNDTSALVERSKTVPGFSNLFTLPNLLLFRRRPCDQAGRRGRRRHRRRGCARRRS